MTRAIAFLRCGLTFAATLFLCGYLLAGTHRLLDEGTVRNKFRHFAAHSGAYDTLFLGSSRTYRQVLPEVFDRITAASGTPTRSFNFGVDGMFAPEDGFVAEQIFRLRPKLRWVFVEVSMFQAAHAEQNAGSARAVYWHDWKRTRLVCQDLLGSLKKFRWKDREKRFRDLREKLGHCFVHLESFGRRTLQIGRGAVLWQMLWPKRRQMQTSAFSLGERGDGFEPIVRPGGMQGPQLAEYNRQYQKRQQRDLRREPLSPAAQENLEGILRLVRETGAEPLLVIAPTTSPIAFVPRRDVGAPLFDFSDMKAWPTLFERKYRADVAHLTEAGGRIYTRFIAERWLAHQSNRRELDSEAVLAEARSPASNLDVADPSP